MSREFHLEDQTDKRKVTKGRLIIASGLVILTVVLFYYAGLFTETIPTIEGPGGFMEPNLPASGFLVRDLSVQPTEVEPNQPVTVSLSVTNTHDTWGIYNLVLQINGVKEAEGQTNLDAHGTERVSFTVTKMEPGKYRVFINGLSGSFLVVGTR